MAVLALFEKLRNFFEFFEKLKKVQKWLFWAFLKFFEKSQKRHFLTPQNTTFLKNFNTPKMILKMNLWSF